MAATERDILEALKDLPPWALEEVRKFISSVKLKNRKRPALSKKRLRRGKQQLSGSGQERGSVPGSAEKSTIRSFMGAAGDLRRYWRLVCFGGTE